MSTTITPAWFSIPDAARYTGFSQTSIRKAIEAGKFPVREVEITGKGRKNNIRIKRTDLDAWIEGPSEKSP
jgi:excisionase family DNA binding protein